MEFLSSHGRKLTIEEFNTDRFLAHARSQARDRGLDKITIVDSILHLEESNALSEILDHIYNPVERQLSRSASNKGRRPFVPRALNYEDAGGRLQRFGAAKLEQVTN